MKTDLIVKFAMLYGETDVKPTGAWRYRPDVDRMTFEVSYIDPAFDKTTRFTTWLNEDEVIFVYENRRCVY